MGLFDGITGAIAVADALSGGYENAELNITKAKSIKELYEAIKDVEFEAGTPVVEKAAGLGDVIAFPPLDKNNQVQIYLKKGKFTIMRSSNVAGKKAFGRSVLLDSMTDGITGLSGNFGSKKEMCNHLVEVIAEQLNGMDL